MTARGGAEVRTLQVDAFAAAFERSRPEGRAGVLVAVGGWGVEGHDRIGLIVLGGRPRVVEDAYLPSSEIEALQRRIARLHEGGATRRGAWNTMHATRWTHAWTDDGAPFELIGRVGWLARAEGERLLLRGGDPVERSEVAAIEPYVAEDWVRRGVRLRLRDGATRDVGHEDDHAPLRVPFYDGLNLLADTAWTHGLARAIHAALGAPIVDCT